MEHNLNWLKLTCIGVVKFSIVVYWSIVLSVYKFNIMPGFRKMVRMKLVVISPKLVIPTCMKVQGSMYKSFKIKSVFFQFLLLHGILLLLFCTLPIFFFIFDCSEWSAGIYLYSRCHESKVCSPLQVSTKWGTFFIVFRNPVNFSLPIM